MYITRKEIVNYIIVFKRNFCRKSIEGEGGVRAFHSSAKINFKVKATNGMITGTFSVFR